MLKIAAKSDLNQISLTGVRAIVILGLLMTAPRTIDEIRQVLVNYNIYGEDSSKDILRIDFNTLKAIGCEFSRPSKTNGYKYQLKKHPFSLKLDIEDIKILKKVYNTVVAKSDIDFLLQIDLFLKKIASYIYEVDIKEALLGISVLKYYNIEFLKELNYACKTGQTLYLEYYSPTMKTSSVKEIVTQKLAYRNGKIYLLGLNTGKKSPIMLNLLRIKDILAKKIRGQEAKTVTTKVKFLLKDFSFEIPQENETVIEETPEGFLIEGEYFNDFIAMQRILSFGSNCKVIEPETFKIHIIAKLKEMSKIYD